jgi:hypothetical protein
MADEPRVQSRAAARAAESKPFQWSDLPTAVRTALASIPRDQWKHVGVTICPTELQSDATALLAVFVRVWDKSRAAEDFRKDRLSGDERDKFRKEFVQALKQIAGTTIKLGIRSKLYGDLQLEKDLLKRCDQETWDSTTKALTQATLHGTPAQEESPRPVRPRASVPADGPPAGTPAV